MLQTTPTFIRNTVIGGLLALICAACQPGGEANSAAEVPSLSSFQTGEFEALDTSMDMDVPDVAIYDTDGATASLADFKGKVLVMNIWATWCTPCMAEMPSLAALQKEFSTDDVVVVPVASGMMLTSRAKTDEEKAAALEEAIEDHRTQLAKLTDGALPFYYDPGADVTFTAQTGAFPSTIIYDRSGKEVVRLMRDADWSSEQATNLVRAVVNGAS